MTNFHLDLLALQLKTNVEVRRNTDGDIPFIFSPVKAVVHRLLVFRFKFRLEITHHSLINDKHTLHNIS